MNSAITVSELKDKLIQHYKFNLELSENGFLPISICATGPSGIGKTSVVEEACKELCENLHQNIKWKKINLANISDASDLIGFPKVKTLIKKDDDERWVWDNNLKKYSDWEITDRTVTAYAPPEWVDYLSDGGILILDDYNRAPYRILQSIMEIIERREYYSWSLPNNVLVVLTGNPADSDYIITKEDKAQKSRYITYDIIFNFETWKLWAVSKGIKYEYIDFIGLNYEELFSEASETNIRQWTKLFSLLSVCNPDDSFTRDFVKSCVGHNSAVIFFEYLKKIHNIEITAEEIFKKSTKYPVIEKKLRDLIFQKDYYRNSVASIIITRIINHLFSFEEISAKEKGNSEVAHKIDTLFRLYKSGIINNDHLWRIIDDLVSLKVPSIVSEIVTHEEMITVGAEAENQIRIVNTTDVGISDNFNNPSVSTGKIAVKNE